MANKVAVDFQIANHNYFLADVLHRSSWKKPLLSNYQLIIADESHKFLAAARQMYGLELTDSEVPNLAKAVHAFTTGKSNRGINAHRQVKKLEEQNAKLFRKLVE